jgi:hypothetical protein
MIRKVLKIFLKLTRPAILLLTIFSLSVNSFAEGEANEYNIKAMFVLNFMKYVEWPSNAKEEVFKIGVAGESELFNALQLMSTNRNENVKVIIEKADPDVTENYQILIVSKKENKKLEEWSKRYQGKGVLIISEECESANNSAINLKNIDNKIRFEVNHSQAKLGGVKISSRLSNLALSVQP